MTFLAFNSPEGRRVELEHRIHVCPGSANAVAVHVVFNGWAYVIKEGSLTRSMVAARKLVQRVMEESDCQPIHRHPPHLQPHATLKPLTAAQACVARNTGGAREYRKRLWETAEHNIDHMTGVRALGQLACLLGMMPNNDD